MAKVINALNGKSVEVVDGDEIRDACDELGVPFGCQNGLCGTCMIDVVSGEENLSEITEQEEILERDKKHRLACQCHIKEGEVGIKW